MTKLQQGVDITFEVCQEDILKADNLLITDNVKTLDKANIYIVTVPTPINNHLFLRIFL